MPIKIGTWSYDYTFEFTLIPCLDMKYRMLTLRKMDHQACEFLKFTFSTSCVRIYSQSSLYNTTLKAIIPLPDPNASPGSPSHVESYQEFPAGSVVMALYPDTSCFYRAEVLSTPKEMQLTGPVSHDSSYH
jgi:hypothetical protein